MVGALSSRHKRTVDIITYFGFALFQLLSKVELDNKGEIMENKHTVVSITFLFTVFIMFVSCEKHKTEWKGTIEEVNGITVVKNPKGPMYGEDIFSLKGDLTIGEKEGKEEYLFRTQRSS